jgi:hypothetical protein
MRYRALDADGDYTFGRGLGNFLIDNRECVAQSVLTRMRLWQGEWFIDKTSGMPWATEVLGKYTLPLYDFAIRQRILGTENVTGIAAYSSTYDSATRAIAVEAEIDTAYGRIQISTPLSLLQAA